MKWAEKTMQQTLCCLPLPCLRESVLDWVTLGWPWELSLFLTGKDVLSTCGTESYSTSLSNWFVETIWWVWMPAFLLFLEFQESQLATTQVVCVYKSSPLYKAWTQIQAGFPGQKHCICIVAVCCQRTKYVLSDQKPAPDLLYTSPDSSFCLLILLYNYLM